MQDLRTLIFIKVAERLSFVRAAVDLGRLQRNRVRNSVDDYALSATDKSLRLSNSRCRVDACINLRAS